MQFCLLLELIKLMMIMFVGFFWAKRFGLGLLGACCVWCKTNKLTATKCQFLKYSRKLSYKFWNTNWLNKNIYTIKKQKKIYWWHKYCNVSNIALCWDCFSSSCSWLTNKSSCFLYQFPCNFKPGTKTLNKRNKGLTFQI